MENTAKEVLPRRLVGGDSLHQLQKLLSLETTTSLSLFPLPASN